MSDGVAGSRFWGPMSKLGALGVVATFFLDQISKWWVLGGLGLAEGQRLAVTPFMNLVLVFNRGISYGLFPAGSGVGQIALALAAFLVSAGLWVWLARNGSDRLFALSLGLIIGGALGNAIDRLWLDGVADFIELHAGGFSWYVFNVADAAIVAGVLGLLYEFTFASRKDAASAP